MKNKYKIDLAIALILVMVAVVFLLLSIIGVPGANTSTKDRMQEAADTQQEHKEEYSVEADKEVKEENESVAEEPGNQEPEVKEPFVADRSHVFELISQMNVGWNLGNSLDAHGVNNLSSETYWGNPKTSKEMIDAVSAQGFNTIRIPVTFSGHVGGAPDYAIDPAWLDRVQEVVDYAVSNDMFILLDTHHEPDYWLIPTEEKYEAVSKQLTAIWKQVAERFRDYDEKLMFEGMNEPRVKGSAEEWNGGSDKEKAVVTKLNQDFIDTVRATGGNNTTRCLIICPYGNNSSGKTLKNLVIPEDNYIAVAIHMYTPYYFTYEPETGSIFEWDGSKKQSLGLAIKEINNYLIAKGVPAIITEFGATHKIYEADGKTVTNEEEVLKWLNDYLGATEKYDIPCIWWDNNNFNQAGERFAIFDRSSCTWVRQRVADALIELTE